MALYSSSVQYLVGVVSFLIRVPSEPQRKIILPYHVAIGTALFFMALFTVETGIVEKETLMKKSGSFAPICSSAHEYSQLPGVSQAAISGGYREVDGLSVLMLYGLL